MGREFLSEKEKKDIEGLKWVCRMKYISIVTMGGLIMYLILLDIQAENFIAQHHNTTPCVPLDDFRSLGRTAIYSLIAFMGAQVVRDIFNILLMNKLKGIISKLSKN